MLTTDTNTEYKRKSLVDFKKAESIVTNTSTGEPVAIAFPEISGSHDNDHQQTWNDIVFQNRNREYGAYVLRRSYAYNVSKGVAVTAFAILLIVFSSTIARWFENTDKEDVVVPRKLVYTELSAPPPIDKPKPPPPQIQLPKLQKVIKFVPPKVVKETVVEEIPTIQEIKQNETAAVETDGATVVFDEPVEAVVPEHDDNEIFTVVEQSPEFEGGYDAMMAFIKANMKYPTMARKMGIEGTVYVSFVVKKDGTIADVKVMRGFMKECDNEAVRVIQMMPNWKPGRQNGQLVNVRFTLPLKFRMN